MKTVAAIIEKDEKILLIRRANTHFFSEDWALPGGKREEGELSIDAAKRETKEEVGLSLNPTYFGTYKAFFSQYGLDSDTDVFYGDLKGEVKTDLNEASEFRWFSLEELNKLNMAFHNKFIIKDFRT